MFTRYTKQNLNTWALFTCLALVALFAAPVLLTGAIAKLAMGIAALFVVVSLISVIAASRGHRLTTFSLLPTWVGRPKD
jgi:hypothetical protein